MPPVVVDPVVGKFLREHQREGVQFMFDCIHGLKPFDGHGCILAGARRWQLCYGDDDDLVWVQMTWGWARRYSPLRCCLQSV
jgi:hypothetical protein